MVRKLYSKESSGGDAAVKKAVAMPAILMAVLCYLAGWVDTLMSLDLQRIVLYIQQGSTDQLRALFEGFARTLGHDSIEQIIGLAFVVVVIVLRRKHLSAVKYKDLIVLAVYFVALVAFGKISSTVNHLLVSEKMGHMANVAIGTKNSTVSMFTVPLLVNWVGLAVFIFARTGAVKLGRVLGGAAALFSLVLSVVCCVSAAKLLPLASGAMANVISVATPLARVALLFDFLGVTTVLFFWLLYGEGKLRAAGAVCYGILQPLLTTLLEVAFIFVGSAMIPDGGDIGAGLVFTGFGMPLAYILGGAYLVGVLLLKKRRKAKKAAKA